MKYVIGDDVTFKASFYNPNNSPATLDADPTVQFFDGNDNLTLLNAVVEFTQTSAAEWSAVAHIPVTTQPGWYKIVWTAMVNGVSVIGSEEFELVLEGYVFINDLEKNLRRRLRDALIDPESDEGAFFLNDEIHSLLAMNGRDVIGAAYDGWLIRAAHYQQFVDISESGSDRRLSQQFKNAQAMVEFYRKAKGATDDARNGALSGRVVGATVQLRGEYVDSFGLVASANYRARQSNGAYVRIFPLHRFAGLSLLPVGAL